jgi:hypothetical protein
LEAIPLKRAIAAVGGDRGKNEYAALAFPYAFRRYRYSFIPSGERKSEIINKKSRYQSDQTINNRLQVFC